MCDYNINAVVVNEERPENVKINEYSMGEIGEVTPKIREVVKRRHNEWANFELTFVLRGRSELEGMEPKSLSKVSCIFIDTRGHGINEDYSQEIISTFDTLCDKINYSYSNTKGENLQTEFGFYTTVILGEESESEKERSEKYNWKEVVREKSHKHVNFASKIRVDAIYRSENYKLDLYLERIFTTMAHNRKLIN